MQKHFSWVSFDRMSAALEAMGYIIAVFGPLIGIALAILGSGFVRVTGVGIVFASILIALYHVSFSLLMNAIHQLQGEINLIVKKD